LIVTRALLDLLRARRVAHGWRGVERWRVGDQLRVGDSCALEPYVHVLGGYALPERMGAFSYSHSMLLPNMRLGRYCSIGGGVEFIQSQHPADWVTSSPFFYAPQGLQGIYDYINLDLKAGSFPLHPDTFRSGPVELGHDVWIGQGAMLSGGVTLGTGAIVGARALVTRDVPPYAIVGGTPARIIRMRFPDTVIERLLALQWWRFGPEVLQPLDIRDPAGFADRLEAKLANDPPQLLDAPLLTIAEMAAAVEGAGA
jgi:acetyltransferase-like isoleucine patch superfamily enzyme